MLKSGLTRYTKQSISQADNYSDLSKEELLRIALEITYNRYYLQREEFVTEEDKHGYKYERI